VGSGAGGATAFGGRQEANCDPLSSVTQPYVAGPAWLLQPRLCWDLAAWRGVVSTASLGPGRLEQASRVGWSGRRELAGDVQGEARSVPPHEESLTVRCRRLRSVAGITGRVRWGRGAVGPPDNASSRGASNGRALDPGGLPGPGPGLRHGDATSSLVDGRRCGGSRWPLTSVESPHGTGQWLQHVIEDGQPVSPGRDGCIEAPAHGTSFQLVSARCCRAADGALRDRGPKGGRDRSGR